MRFQSIGVWIQNVLHVPYHTDVLSEPPILDHLLIEEVLKASGRMTYRSEFITLKALSVKKGYV